MRRRRLLAVTGVSRLEGGFLLRVANLLPELAREWDISLVETCGPDLDTTDWPGSGVLDVVSVPPLPRWNPTPRSPADTAPLRKAVADVLARRKPDAALLWLGAEFLAFARSGFPPAVADRIDSFTLDRLRYARHARPWPKRLTALRRVAGYARYERRMVRELGVTVVAAEDDARILRQLSGRGRVVVVPNGVAVSESPNFGAESSVPTLAFTGTLSHPPNVDAVRHLVRNLWPAIRSEVSDARLLVAGRDPGPRVRELAGADGVELRPDVGDMAALLQESWVAVAPMRFGAGIKNKVLEAWAVGRPAVLSPVATGGLALDGQMRELVAADPAEFRTIVIDLLRDRRRRHHHGRLAHDLATSRHTWRQCSAAFSTLLQAVSANPATSPVGAPS
jgi:glycosyltransferase involved in cell wall biosynthesis